MRGKKEAWTGDQNGPLIFVNLSIKKKYVRKFQIWVFIESYKHFKFQNSEIQYQFPIRKQPKKSIGVISAKSNRSLLTYWYGQNVISDKKYGKYLMSEK